MKKKWLLICGIIAIPLSIYTYCMIRAHDKLDIACACDELLSEDAHERIAQVLAQIDTTKGLAHVKRLVQTSVPVIAYIEEQRINNSTCIMTFHADKVSVRTTQKMVITARGDCVAQEMYARNAYEQLPCIAIATRDRQSLQLCARWVAQVPRSFFDIYTIQWKSHTSILLEDKEHPGMLIHCSAATMPREEERMICTQCAQQTNVKLKKNQVCVCDIRFDKQIIVRPMMLGGA